jgi:hypothetical protein
MRGIAAHSQFPEGIPHFLLLADAAYNTLTYRTLEPHGRPQGNYTLTLRWNL